ncbi:hypothetical protein E7T06_07275 [Deinococcus sp. Arct2-2]|uniref:hypothetical protein n=1 Tax=Deinococcus sp. Arct2-2 TaxID=2568653 RepID=UPI0010A39761|nr:hypothetical protein [Deinococcus sp. Arct2-2]THF70498.1 hypothetical protein E7T06_07275 [Deinococcus sp. Arct2-2]
MTQPTPQPRSYDESLLLPVDLTSEDWGRTWVRQFMRDYPEVRTGGVSPQQPQRDPMWPEFSRTDAALNASLFLDAVQLDVNGTVTPYYRPHFTAARLYLGDPNLWRTRSVDGSSETRRDPLEVIRAWLNQGRAFDALFPSGTLLPAFEVEEVETVSGTPDYSPSAIPLIIGGL